MTQQTIRNLTVRPDSLEFGTKKEGGKIKIYFDTEEDYEVSKRRLTYALRLRYDKKKIKEEIENAKSNNSTGEKK